MRRWSIPFSRLAPPHARRRWYRRLGYTAAAVVALLAAIQVLGRLWLPHFAERRADIAAYLSERSGYQIEIGGLEAYWEGLNPGLAAHGFSVRPRQPGAAPVDLRELRLTLAWLPLLAGRTEINSLTLVQPRLTIERRENGQISVGGFDRVATDAGPEGEGFLRWLFAQRSMLIEDGELRWLDHGAREPEIRLGHVYLELRNSGERHRVNLRADFPPALCRGCGVTADVRGNPFIGESWTGQVQLRAIGLNPEALPGILRKRLPAGLKGDYSAQLWSEWRDGALESVYGRLGVTGFTLPLRSARRPVSVREAETDIEWRARGGGSRLELRNLRLGVAGPAWWAGTLRIDREASGTRLRLSHLDLKDAAAFLAAWPGEEEASRWARAFGPTGGLDDIDLQVQHPDTGNLDYTAAADVRNLAIEPDRDFPGLRGVSGKLRFGSKEGEFTLNADAGSVHLPRVFRESLPWRKASGRLRWARGEGQWQIQGQGVRIQSEDGRLQGDFTLRVPDGPGGSPHLSLSAQLRDGNGAHAARYYPAILPPEVRRWLEASIRGGEITHGRVVFDGAVADFPFRDGSGRFEVSAHLRNGELEYLPGWPVLTQIEADLLFRGAGMVITGHRGRIHAISASQVTVRIEDLELDRKPLLQVTGRAEGGVNEALDVFYRAPRLSEWFSFLPPGVQADGTGRLVLDLAVPLTGDAPARVAGEYRVERAALHFPLTGLSLRGLDGAVRFSRHGPIGAALRGEVLGGPFELSGDRASARAGEDLHLRAAGRLTAQGLARVVGPALAGRIEGAAGWAGQVRMRGNVPEFHIETDVGDLAIQLPAPLTKARAAPARLILHTTTSSADSHVLNLAFGERLSGRLAFRRSAGRWHFAKGRLGIGVGQVALPETDGLDIELRTAALDGDDWARLFREAGGGSPVWAARISRVRAEIGALRWFDMPLGRVALSLARWPSGWLGQVDGAVLAGDVMIHPGTPAAVALNLQHLRIPSEFFEVAGKDIDPSDLPPLQVESAELSLLGHRLGALKMRTSPTPQGLTIEELKVVRPETQLSAQGEWNAVAPGHASTRLEVQVNSSDLGSTLEAFGFPDELSGGRLELASRWAWPGAPMDFDAGRLDGSISISLADGRLLPIEQGAGRLFGILNLRSLARFLTLDFKTLFGKGFAFDTFKGGFTVARGDARTNGLVIKGQNATIVTTGRLGLAARDLELQIDVLPRFKEELAITGLLLGSPVVGAAVLALQELLRKPIAESTRARYTVSGPWTEPVVTPRARKPSEEGAERDVEALTR